MHNWQNGNSKLILKVQDLFCAMELGISGRLGVQVEFLTTVG